MSPCFRLSLPMSHLLSIVLKLQVLANTLLGSIKNCSLVPGPTVQFHPLRILMIYFYTFVTPNKSYTYHWGHLATVLYLFRRISLWYWKGIQTANLDSFATDTISIETFAILKFILADQSRSFKDCLSKYIHISMNISMRYQYDTMQTVIVSIQWEAIKQ